MLEKSYSMRVSFRQAFPFKFLFHISIFFIYFYRPTYAANYDMRAKHSLFLILLPLCFLLKGALQAKGANVC